MTVRKELKYKQHEAVLRTAGPGTLESRQKGTRKMQGRENTVARIKYKEKGK